MNEHNEFIVKIEQLASKVEAAVRGLNDSQLDTPTGPGKWSVRQLVHHIADANMNAFIRMKLIASEEKPILKPYDQDRWMAQADGKTGRIESSLSIIKGVNERWVLFLQSLPEASWSRAGIHLENGKVTIEDLLRLYSKHGETHTQQIVTFRETMKW
jgi:uncharacterized damage-inducible protein DinB